MRNNCDNVLAISVRFMLAAVSHRRIVVLQVVGMLFGTGLRGEGNILHHLRPCAYRLTHVQSRLHEFDFAVHSLAADLGDGLRLCKLAEKLTGA